MNYKQKRLFDISFIQGVEVNSEDLRHIWPIQLEYINVYGKYEFNLAAVQHRNGLQELRQPEALDP